MKAKLAEDGNEASTNRRLMMENGHPGVEVDEAAIRRGENPYTKYYQQQGEAPVPANGQVRSLFVAFTYYVDKEAANVVTQAQAQPLRYP